MKKLLTFALFTSLAFSAVIDLGIGGGLNLNQKAKEKVEFKGTDVNFDEKANSSFYLWGYFEHPIPVVPSLRLEYNKASFENVKLTTSAGSAYKPSIKATIVSKEFDLLLYYSPPIINNPMFDLDLGFGGKLFEQTIPNSLTDKSIYDIKPLLYARARVDFFIGLEAMAKFIYQDSYEATIKADYTFDLPILGVGLEAGYRLAKMKKGFGILNEYDASTAFFGGFVKF